LFGGMIAGANFPRLTGLAALLEAGDLVCIRRRTERTWEAEGGVRQGGELALSKDRQEGGGAFCGCLFSTRYTRAGGVIY